MPAFPWFDFQGSRFVFNNVNYNYTNSNLGSHFARKHYTRRPYLSVKDIANKRGVGIDKRKRPEIAKAL